MEQPEVPTAHQQLQAAIEQWYVWLSSNPGCLFGVEDIERMNSSVAYFHKTSEWLSRTTLLNTEWFFEEGSQIVMNRWSKGDYDSYE